MVNCLLHLLIYALFILLIYRKIKSDGDLKKDGSKVRTLFVKKAVITGIVALVVELVIYAVSGIINYLVPLWEGFLLGIRFCIPALTVIITVAGVFLISRKAGLAKKSITTLIISLVTVAFSIFLTIMEKNLNEEMLLSTSEEIINSDVVTMKVIYAVTDAIACIPMIAYAVDVLVVTNRNNDRQRKIKKHKR